MIRLLCLAFLCLVLAGEAGADSPADRDRAWGAAVAKYAPQRDAELDKLYQIDRAGPFGPDWTSLADYKVPSWYADAKFGIFIHWGIYSVPAFGNEWYGRDMYDKTSAVYRHHVAIYGSPDKFGYKDFIPLFKAEHYDPAAWAKLFRDAGARYVVPVAEHHDTFSLYDSHLSDWTAVKMGPKRDLIGDLAAAVRAEGLHFGLSSHRAEHDWFFDEGFSTPSDVQNPANAGFYGPAQRRMKLTKDDDDLDGDFTPVSQAWLNDWLVHSAELVDLYHPDLIYFDWWIAHPSFRNTLPQFLAYYYNDSQARGALPVVNYKHGAFWPSAGVLDIERGQLPGIQPTTWQTCTSISEKSWGYIENDHYKPADILIHQLVDVVSKNGNLLLNVGPRADGTIPEAAQATLRAIGQWLGRNGEAIYGSHPWRRYGEGPTDQVSGAKQEGKAKPFTARDFRFTVKDGVLYAIELGWPGRNETVIHALTAADHVTGVGLLGGPALAFVQRDDGLHITLPARPAGPAAYVYRIEIR